MARVLVTGANGRTGRAVVDALQARGVTARGLVRRPEHGDRLAAMGAEAALGDLEDAASLDAAVAGCGAVIHIGPPMYPREVETTDAMLQAARANGVGRFVYYSVMQPLRQDIEHHRMKLIAEAHVVQSGLPYVIVQPIRYMQHLEPIWRQVRGEGVHAMPFNTQVRFNLADLTDLAEATARTALDEGHLYASYELAGPQALSQTDMAAILSEELGKPVLAQAMSPERFRDIAAARGMDEDRIRRAQIMNRHYDLHGFRGNPNVLTWVLGRPPRSFRDYVRDLIQRGA